MSLSEVCEKQELPLNLCIVYDLLWTANAQKLGSWVTLPCHIHLGGALKIIKIKYMHPSPSKVNDHIRIGKIISSNMHKCSL